jgi:glycosidase
VEERLSKYLPNPEVKSSGSSPIEARAAASAVSGATSPIDGVSRGVCESLPAGLDFFLKKLRKSVKDADPNALIIGEVWEDASSKIAYAKRREYLQGEELDSVMNDPLKDAIIWYMQTENAMQLLQTVRSLIDHYPKQTVDCLMNILGTLDTARILTVLGGIHCANKEEMATKNAYLTEEKRRVALEKLKMAALLQYTLPGVPCLYYGDENASEGHIDPFCRKCFDWDNMNEELIAYYAKLGTIRKEYHDIFKDGGFKALSVDHGFIIYKRYNTKNDVVYVYVNNSSKNHLIKLQGNYKNCLTDKQLKNQHIVEPYSYGIFKEI